MAQELFSQSLFNSANLISYYRLEDVNDSKGSNNLTNNNTVTFSAAQFNNGANFGTANTNKHLSNTSTLSIDGGAIGISFWVKCLTEVDTGTDYTFVYQGNNANKVNYYVRYQYNAGTRRLAFRRTKLGVGDQNVLHNVTLGTSDFYHIVLNYDTTNIEGFVNGVSVGTAAASGNGTDATVDGIGIGSWGLGTDTFSSALIDDVAFFNRALTASEVSAIFTGSSRTNLMNGYFEV